MQQRVPKFTIRLTDKAQLQRFRKAAADRRWSVNRFILESCEAAAKLPVIGIVLSKPVGDSETAA